MFKQLRNVAIATYALISLSACGDGANDTEARRQFLPAPTTQPPEPLRPQFAGWEMVNGSYGGVDPAYISLWVNSPTRLYEGEPDEATGRALLREATHICTSQYARDQLSWLTESFSDMPRPEQIRIFFRYETAPQGTPGRVLYGHEVLYEIENGACGRRVIREPVLEQPREDTFIYRQ
ncbi:MAG: hypothetical protein AAGI92_06020 [Pseudomonadota bacterium]